VSCTDVNIVVYEVSTGAELVNVDDVAANGDSMDWSNHGNSINFHSLDLSAHPFRIKQFDTSNMSVKLFRNIC